MEKGLVSCTGSGEEKNLDLEADVLSAQGESHERQIEIRAKTPERKLEILISLSLLSGSLL